jgi:hypothetical protein
MATAEERDRFRQLAGKQLPAEPTEETPNPDPEPYTDEQADAYLNAVPACPATCGSSPSADVYGAAANAWDDKAEQLEVAAVAAGGGTHLVTESRQGDAAVKFAKAVPVGSLATAANDPRSMRTLAARLRRRSCNGGAARSVTVEPPMVLRPGDGGIRDYDGDPGYYDEGRALILDPVDNPDLVINLPEVDD